MARVETCVLTNMCMVYSGTKLLVMERKNKDWGGLTFPGGHVEAKERFDDAVIREVKEETGLDIANVQLCGITQWVHKDNKFRYIAFLYKTDTFSGELKCSDEGEIFWIERADLHKYALSDGFEDMLEVYEETASEKFFITDQDDWVN